MGAHEDIKAGLDMNQIAGLLGTDEQTAESAVDQALSSLVSQMSGNVDDESGATALARALGGHVNSDAFGEQIDTTVVDTADGEAIVSHVYGNQIQQFGGGAGAHLILTAGQGGQALGGELRAAPVDVEAATAWRMGRLVVRDRPLSEVVESFNRYASERLTLTDAAAGEVRISGSFRYDGGQEFVMALARGFDLSVQRTTDGDWRIGTPGKSSDAAATL